MADFRDKWKDNARGSYYVDQRCIDCNLCQEISSKNFKRSKDGYSVVYKQPVNANEIELCEEAIRQCPVEAIGNNG